MDPVHLILVCFLILGIGLALLFAFKKSSTKEKYTEERKVRVCLFYATWCPHCETYLRTGKFDDAAHMAASKPIKFEKIDYEQNKNLANKYDINGFPTIIALDSNGSKLGEFNGDRNSPIELIKFAETYL